MKNKVILIAILAMMTQLAYAGVGGPPGIFYEQFFDRGDQLKLEYRDVPGGVRAYKKYSEELKKKNERNSKQIKTEHTDDLSQNTGSFGNIH